MTVHEVKIEVSDSVWATAESRAKEENTDALNLIRTFLMQALESEFGVALPKTDIDKEDDTPV
jgi:acyl carrier protein